MTLFQERKNAVLVCGFMLLMGLTACKSQQIPENKRLAQEILNDQRFVEVDRLARSVIKEGFNAGSGYSQIWARDLNTFIETALEERSSSEVRGAILLFFALQQANGEMVDGYVVKKDFTWNDDTPYYAETAPEHVGFKNTVETDQETSLIQLLGKYIQKTGDYSILEEKIGDKTVMARIEWMLDYLRKERFNTKYGLLWGAMTADWGDVQPHDDFGCDWNSLSHEAIDVYDNAMLIIALQYMADFAKKHPKSKEWAKWKDEIARNTRKHLWDKQKQKFIPHLYPNGSPLPAGFDENEIHYHGGTAVAIEAGLLSKAEIAVVNKQMVENVRLSGMPSIGLTLYPTYPKGFFRGWMSDPYAYQNGGDWTWFGGRMIQQLIKHGFVKEAYTEVRPMIERVIKNQGFHEWYGKGDIPSGSGKFKGAAGVLSTSIAMFNDWASEVK
ncbi:GH36-type glycosyl hydrolase domain-containing protein [Sphingobacterium psychroaquaticum]|uniref:Amylo-alpha-1,6-glucosidase n=1 Tax=Sphingobacterium psychroaquaticum TaxID=561061 RepID=A0A1X7IHZ5_9SPHI|nr:amylo-alpha-1,6-glucosidase [Sphingobacterium psychroaquaticum]SMG13942.1 Amylo-alpha-1,6-glucosidase [Sphingobacterium psychroaquaticum]